MVLLRRVCSIVCLVLLALLIPVSVVGVWAQNLLLNEDKFVQTFAPLVTDPDVQVALSAEVSRVVIEQIDVDALTAEAFEGLEELGLPSRATAALGLLQGPAAEGIRSLIVTGTERLVESPAFANVWQSTLALSHRTLLSVATQDDFARGFVTTSNEGEVAIQLAPIITAVTAELESRGYSFAGNLETVDASFVVAQSDVLPLLGLVYSIADQVGTWIPVSCVVLAAAAIALSQNRRATAFRVLAVSFGVAVVLLVFTATAVGMAPGAITSQPEGSAAIAAILSQVLGGIRVSLWWIVACSVVAAIALLLLWKVPEKQLAEQPDSAAVTASQ